MPTKHNSCSKFPGVVLKHSLCTSGSSKTSSVERFSDAPSTNYRKLLFIHPRTHIRFFFFFYSKFSSASHKMSFINAVTTTRGGIYLMIVDNDEDDVRRPYYYYE